MLLLVLLVLLCLVSPDCVNIGNELFDTEDWLVFATAGEGNLKSMAADKRSGRLHLDPTLAIAICTKGDSRSVVEISGAKHNPIETCTAGFQACSIS